MAQASSASALEPLKPLGRAFTDGSQDHLREMARQLLLDRVESATEPFVNLVDHLAERAGCAPGRPNGLDAVAAMNLEYMSKATN